MKYTQNERILQITEKTLIVGIDVGSEKHYARAFNFRGVEFGKLLIFENNAQGFVKLMEWAGKIANTSGFTDVTLGMEPTGHYWFNLAENTMKSGARIVLVNPHHVKKSKELDTIIPARRTVRTQRPLLCWSRMAGIWSPTSRRITRNCGRLWTAAGILKELSAIKNRLADGYTSTILSSQQCSKMGRESSIVDT